LSDFVYVAEPLTRPSSRMSFSRVEWTRLAAIYGFIAVLHLLGWDPICIMRIIIHSSWVSDSSLTCSACATLRRGPYCGGRRYRAFHAQKGKKPLGSILLFPGTFTVVLALSIAIAFAAAAVKAGLPALKIWEPSSGRVSPHIPLDHRHSEPAGVA